MELQKINTQKQLLRRQIKEKIVCLDPAYCHQADKLEIFSKGRNDILLCGNCRGDSYQTADSGCFGSGKAGGCAKMHFKGDHGGTADPFSWRIVSRKLWH